jgi:DNA-binding XRE family transcriptional regulator
LTVEDAALSIGVAKQTLSDLEAGKESVGLGLVLRITRDLGVALFVAPAAQRERFRRMLTATGNA